MRRHPPQLLCAQQHQFSRSACLRVPNGHVSQHPAKSIFSPKFSSWSSFPLAFEGPLTPFHCQTLRAHDTANACELVGKRSSAGKLARHRGRLGCCPRSSCARAGSDSGRAAAGTSRSDAPKLNMGALRGRPGRPQNRQYSPHRRPLEGSWQHSGLWRGLGWCECTFFEFPPFPRPIFVGGAEASAETDLCETAGEYLLM